MAQHSRVVRAPLPDERDRLHPVLHGPGERNPEDPSKPQRQQTFIRALETLDGFSVHYGSFLSNKVWMPRATRLPGQKRKVGVVKTEEKGSDVNLASLLLADGFRGNYKAAVVLSNDSDLMLPIKIVSGELGLPVGLLNPHPPARSARTRGRTDPSP